MEELIAKLLVNVKKRLKIQDAEKDDLLNLLIKQSINSILIYINEISLPENLEGICEEVACAIYRKIGTEGITAETVDTVSYTYTNDALTSYISILDKFVENRDKIKSKLVKFY